MYDNRFCATARTATGSMSSGAQVCGVPVGDPNSFWWITAAINHAWATAHGYELLLYCMHDCRHPDSGERRSSQWCKLIALAHALSLGSFETLLYFDTDAFWKDTQQSMLDGLVQRFAPELLQQSHPSSRVSATVMNAAAAPPAIYFGCNSPWDWCGVRWSFKEPHAASGSAGTGLILVRSGQRARMLLREWWHARNGWARPQNFRTRGTCSDQAVLWRMWSTRHDLAAWMQVLGRPLNRTAAGAADGADDKAAARAAGAASAGHRTPGRRLKGLKRRLPTPPRTCMRIAGNMYQQRGSPVKHLSSFNPSYRFKWFGRAWNETRHLHDSRWCVRRYELDVPSVAARLFGRVDATRGVSGEWFRNHEPQVAADASVRPMPQVCAGGVLHESINVCCDAACGPLCGGHGSNCSKRPGGSRRCCAPVIQEQGPLCNLPEDVACRLPGSKPLSGASASRKRSFRESEASRRS